MNAEIVNNGVEVYMNRLFELTDLYIDEKLQGDEEKLIKRFRELLFFIADRIERPDNGNIDGLDNLFDAYVRLCCRYDKLPTLEGFSFLTKTHRSTFDDWKNMRYRASTTRYADAIKRWYDICKSFVIDELSNSKAANVNLIFTAKSAYGLRETSPVPAPETELRKRVISADEPLRLDGVLSASELPRLGDISEQKDTTELPDLSTGNGQLPD